MKIRQKLLLSILPAVLIIFVSITYLNYVSSKKALDRRIKQGALNMLNTYTQQLDNTFLRMQDLAQDLSLALQNLESKSDAPVKDSIQDFLNTRPDAYGSAVAFEPGSFGELQALVGLYYHRTKDGLVYVDLADSAYNYPNWDWYKIPIQTGKPRWSEPYVDVGGGNVAMTTYSFPMIKDSKPWGVATVDLSLANITRMVNSIVPGETGYAFLISKTGIFLSLKREEWELKRSIFDAAKDFGSSEFEQIGKQMTSGETAFVSVVDPLSDKPSRIAFGPIPSTGWSLGIVFPESELTADLTALHTKIVLIAIAGIIAIFAIIYFVSGKISGPISTLAEGAQRIASGDFLTKLKNPGTNDEVGALAKALGGMKETLLLKMSEIREDRDLFETAFTQMSDGLIIVGNRWQVLEYNPVAERLLNIKNGDILLEHLDANFESTLPFVQLQNQCNEYCSFTMAQKTQGLKFACKLTPVYDDNHHIKERVLNVREIV